MENFIQGTTPTPARFIEDTERKMVENKEFITFSRQDSLLGAWLLSSISSNLLPQIVGRKSSYEIWSMTEKIFNSQSAAEIMHYKRRMQNLRKDGMSMREYLTKMKTYCDLLEAAGHKTSKTKHVLSIMNGLDEEYEAVVVLSSKETTHTLQHVHPTLLAHVARLDHKKSINHDMAVNYTSRNIYNNQNNQRGG